MILHIVKDEKFIDGFIEYQKTFCPNIKNEYLAWPSKCGKLQNIKNKSVAVIDIHSVYSIIEYIKNKRPSKVIFHNLDKKNWPLVIKIPNEITIGWIFYGAEIFNRPENLGVFLGKKTLMFLKSSPRTLINHLLAQVKFFIENAIYKTTGLKISLFLKALHRVNFIAHWIEEDYEFIKRKYSLKALKFVNFCYSNETLGSIENKSKKNLLIGNSAAFTNNHLDIITKIPLTFSDQFNKIIFPLSYSGSAHYKNVVKNAAKSKFGDKAVILDTFINKEEYFKLLSSVKLAIMGSYRSQGGGNIRFFLKNEIDLMLSEKNNIYKFYKNHSANLHLVESISDGFCFFSEEKKQKNKNLVMQLFEGKKIKDYYEAILK